MSAVEKVLENLVDSMHKIIASGHGQKSVDVSKELKKANKDVEVPKEETSDFFARFMAKENKIVPRKSEVRISSFTKQPTKKKK